MIEISANDIKRLREQGKLTVRNGNLIIPSLFEEINKDNEKQVMTLAMQSNEFKNKLILELLRQRYNEKKALFLKGNIPSKKNSKEIKKIYTGKSVCCNSTYTKRKGSKPICNKCLKETEYKQRSIIANSKLVDDFIERTKLFFVDNRSLFHNMIAETPFPIFLGMYLVRSSERDFDFNNASHIITDLMKENNWIIDDDVDNIIPVYLGHHKEKENAGCILTILNNDKYKELLLECI